MDTRKDVAKAEKERQKRNKGWEENHALITEAYLRLIKQLKRRPTLPEVQKEIARPAVENETLKIAKKLGIDTICNHLQQLEFNPIDSPLRILTDQVLISVANTAMKGSSASQKLWFQLVEGWKEGTELSGPNGAAIPITHNLDLSKLSVDELKALQALTAKATTAVNNDSNPTTD